MFGSLLVAVWSRSFFLLLISTVLSRAEAFGFDYAGRIASRSSRLLLSVTRT
jgi:hypothetical protein